MVTMVTMVIMVTMVLMVTMVIMCYYVLLCVSMVTMVITHAVLFQQIVRSNSFEKTQSTIELSQEQDASIHDKELQNIETQQPQQRLPHFIIIGVKKCGTGALINFLKIHPDIATRPREVRQLQY